jgi:hypothetical protein
LPDTNTLRLVEKKIPVLDLIGTCSKKMWLGRLSAFPKSDFLVCQKIIFLQ